MENKSYNEIKISGQVFKDVETKRIGETNLAQFTLSRSQGKDKNTDKWRPSIFIDVLCWNELAEKASRLIAKDKVILTGRLQMDQWVDKTTGKNRSILKIIAADIQTERAAAKDDFDVPF